MATFRFSILGGAVPDTTGRARMQPYTLTATNDIFGNLVLAFDDPAGGQEHGIYGTFEVPENYVGTASVVLRWTTSATSGNCRWRFGYRAVGGDDSESLDQATFQEQVAVTDAAPSAAQERMTPSFSITSGNFAAGDTVEFYLSRFDDSGTDTLAAVAVVFDAMFQYADA